MVKQDPENTLRLYDLDEEQCDALLDAVIHDKHEDITQLASEVGMNWDAPRVSGLGALSDDDLKEGSRLTAAPGTPGPGGAEGFIHTPAEGSDPSARQPF
jgi:hypothetical protein